MLVSQAIEALQKLPQDKELHCQVVGSDGGAWSMQFEFADTEIPRIAVLTVSHHQLKKLPEWPNAVGKGLAVGQSID